MNRLRFLALAALGLLGPAGYAAADPPPWSHSHRPQGTTGTTTTGTTTTGTSTATTTESTTAPSGGGGLLPAFRFRGAAPDQGAVEF